MIINSNIIWLIWAIIIVLANYSEYKLDVITRGKPKAKQRFKQGIIHGWRSSALITLCAYGLINAIQISVPISINYM